jgi:hypothetical protein
MANEINGDRRFLISLPAYTLGELVTSQDGDDPAATTVLLRCPEYPTFLPLFTDRDLAGRVLERLRAPGKVVLELPSAAAVRDLVRALAASGRATHVGIDVSPVPGGTYGLFAPIREALGSMTPSRRVAACP